MDLLSRHLPKADLAILADQQTAGRGRLNGRLWASPLGNFYCSYIINLKSMGLEIFETNAITLIVMNCLRHYLVGITDSDLVEIKLPNDILVKDKKLAGVLTEISYPYAVIGIGINLINSPIERATNLQSEFNLLVKPNDLVENLFEVLIKGLQGCCSH